MAKSTDNKNVAGFALQFISSLFFLAVVAALYVPSGYLAGSGWSAAALWIPILYAVAVVGSISLFLMSFAQLGGGMAEMAAHKAMMMSGVVGVALVALTAGNSTWFVATLIGLILGFLGRGACPMKR